MTRRRWALLITLLVVLLAALMLSPYPTVHTLVKALEAEDLPALRREIPALQLLGLVPNSHPDRRWQGAGKSYLSHVWPQLYSTLDRHAWLSIEAQTLKKQQHQHFIDFNHYALDIGASHDQIRFEFRRHQLFRWQLSTVCYPNPQPDVVVKRCPSSKR
jgi:hypothetical protein